jgi:hypothetical protein
MRCELLGQLRVSRAPPAPELVELVEQRISGDVRIGVDRRARDHQHAVELCFDRDELERTGEQRGQQCVVVVLPVGKEHVGIERRPWPAEQRLAAMGSAAFTITQPARRLRRGTHQAGAITRRPDRSDAGVRAQEEGQGRIGGEVREDERARGARRRIDRRRQSRSGDLGARDRGSRIHGTTGKQPLVVFEEVERAQMHPLPAKRFELVIWKKAKVHQDTHVTCDRALYSVPWRLIRKEVWVRATASTIAIYADETRVATHARIAAGRRSTMEDHLPEGRRELRHRHRGYWEDRAEKISLEVREYISAVFDSDDVLSQLRSAQAIVTYLEKFPSERAIAACRRARFYENYSYVGIKRILTDALDLEPLPNAIVPTPERSEGFRFARSVSELVGARSEVRHEPH